jgi:general stress protein YciG
MPNKPRKPRGFAAMSAERRREISRQGGQAAQAKGAAHQFNHEEAVVAGKKGGKVAHARGKAHRFTRKEAIAAARKRKGWRKRQEPSP